MTQKAVKTFYLGAFLILESSLNHFYAVFDRRMDSWEENCMIMSAIAIYSKNVAVMRYELMQIRKGSSTLRIGRKGVKPPPKIVYLSDAIKRNGRIKKFLGTRNFILSLILNNKEPTVLFI